MCPERELLVQCAKVNISTCAAERITTLIPRVTNWAWLMRHAVQHGVMPMLYRNITNLCPGDLPADVQGRLQSYYRLNAFHNLVLVGELLDLVALLNAHRVPAISLKGPILAETIFNDMALRQFADLDILILEKDIHLAKEIMISNGFNLTYSPANENSYIRYKHEYNFVKHKANSLVVVDIEWRFANTFFRFPIEPTDMWNRSKPVVFRNRTVLQPTPEDLLLYLCGHGTKHCWSRLKWISDLDAFVLHYPELDWGFILNAASTRGGESMVLLGLCLAHNFFETELPNEIHQSLSRKRKIGHLANSVVERLYWSHEEPRNFKFGKLHRVYGDFGMFDRMIFYILVRDCLSDKVLCARDFVHTTFIRLFLPNDLDRSVMRLPNSLSFLYFLLRLMRLSGKLFLQFMRYLGLSR